ncbi:cyclin-like protein [Jimgerdemannia flammicorona]|uniref:Cyclin-like protein n=1 Tax=Jimgerdemannia flammicorona TaxID=994334 RepID=A0A433DNJ2_9FUNG|nr:cyclin-like protein [Jimgerdemannia flammicorona]
MRRSGASRPLRLLTAHSLNLSQLLQEIGATCIFLATKVEETGRKMRDIVQTVAQKASKKDNVVYDEGSREYTKWRDIMLYLEEVLLEAICFDLTIEHPYSILLKHVAKINGSKKLAQTAWAFINDSLRTPLCVIYRPQVISAAALLLAAKLTNQELIGTDSDTDMGGNERSTVGDEVANEILDQYNSMPQGGKTITAPAKPSSEYRPNTPNPTSPITQLNTPSYYSDGGAGTTVTVANGNGHGFGHSTQGVKTEAIKME